MARRKFVTVRGAVSGRRYGVKKEKDKRRPIVL